MKKLFMIPCWFDTTTDFYINVSAENENDAFALARKMLTSSDPEIHRIIDTAAENNITAIDHGEINILDELIEEVEQLTTYDEEDDGC